MKLNSGIFYLVIVLNTFTTQYLVEAVRRNPKIIKFAMDNEEQLKGIRPLTTQIIQFTAKVTGYFFC